MKRLTYRCPNCNSDQLNVAVTVTARLLQDKDNFETDLDEGGHHHWDGTSVMQCRDCGYRSVSDSFWNDEENDDA
jgi:hypothetical protein